MGRVKNLLRHGIKEKEKENPAYDISLGVDKGRTFYNIFDVKATPESAQVFVSFGVMFGLITVPMIAMMLTFTLVARYNLTLGVTVMSMICVFWMLGFLMFKEIKAKGVKGKTFLKLLFGIGEGEVVPLIFSFAAIKRLVVPEHVKELEEIEIDDTTMEYLGRATVFDPASWIAVETVPMIAKSVRKNMVYDDVFPKKRIRLLRIIEFCLIAFITLSMMVYILWEVVLP